MLWMKGGSPSGKLVRLMAVARVEVHPSGSIRLLGVALLASKFHPCPKPPPPNIPKHPQTCLSTGDYKARYEPTVRRGPGARNPLAPPPTFRLHSLAPFRPNQSSPSGVRVRVSRPGRSSARPPGWRQPPPTSPWDARLATRGTARRRNPGQPGPRL